LKSLIRILVVDDYLPFRRLVKSSLGTGTEFQVIDEAADGLQAVLKAQDLQPDLIILDVGLPVMDGIEAAQRIREVSPKSTILFLSENRSQHVVQNALRSGAGGYVVKSEMRRELLSAVHSVLKGGRFVSSIVAHHDPFEPEGTHAALRHEAGFYSDDQWLLEHVTSFVGTALREENSAVVLATASHRNILLTSLRVFGVDVAAAIEQGRYIALDAVETLSAILSKGVIDRSKFMRLFSGVIDKALKAARTSQPRASIFGECSHLLCVKGNVEAAMQIERLGNRLADDCNVDILCGFSVNELQGAVDESARLRIRAMHAAVHVL
jgi:DNA-binding NarL/FixJ family response regulator